MTTTTLTDFRSQLTLDTIAEWFDRRANGLYGGEAVTQLEHALQCAAMAQAEGATPALVTAALVHDIGHLVNNADDAKEPHDRGCGAAALLGRRRKDHWRRHAAACNVYCDHARSGAGKRFADSGGCMSALPVSEINARAE